MNIDNDKLINQNVLKHYILQGMREENKKLSDEMSLYYKKLALLEERVKILEDKAGVTEIMSEWAEEIKEQEE